MLKVTPIGAGRDAVNYYAGLVREADDDGSWEQKKAGARGHVEDYYLAREDEGGRWWGQGTAALGVQAASLGTRAELQAIFAFQHAESGEQLGQRPREDTIRAYDLTFSAPKTVSLLASLLGGDAEREALDAHEAAVAAALTLIEERTTTRGGKGGRYRLDTGGLAVLAVRHRTSRALDPQLHTHGLVMARVQGTDGRWRSLDATTMMRGVMAFGAIYQSALRAEITRRFPGIRFGAVVKGQAEIEGLDELKALFSKRSAQIDRRYEQELARWRVRNPDRSPTLKEEARLRDRAALASRGAKRGALSLEELRAGWLSAARERALDPLAVLDAALHPEVAVERPAPATEEVARQAIEALAAERSVFSREHVERQVAMRIGECEGRTAKEQARAIEATARVAIETRCIDLVAVGEDGKQRAAALAREPALERYTTPALMAEEQTICRWLDGAAAQGGQPASDGRMARAAAQLIAAGTEKANAPVPTDEQVRAAALIAGSHRAAVVVGPAGAGKTTTLKLVAAALAQERRGMLVLTPWARAAAAVRESTGVPAENVKRYLTEREREADLRPELSMRRGGTVVIDEAGTLPTPDWRALLKVAQEDGLRVVFVGDGRQLAAVGRGGMFEAARERLAAVELARVYRFNAPWEREASRELRAGRQEAILRYLEHGRVVSGAADQVHARMLADWQEAHGQGQRYAFCVPTREQAAYLSARAQARLIESGEIDASRAIETVREQRLHVGDLVATRQNERRAERVAGGEVRNREVWTVRAIHTNGSLALERGRAGGRGVTVCTDYAREHVELAYFQTVHAVQGHTVMCGGVLVDERSGFRSLYVGMTRGRAENTAYVVREDREEAREVMGRALLRDRADLGVLAQARELSELARRRLAVERPTRDGPERWRGRERARERERPLVREGRIVLGARREREAPGLDIGV